MKRSFIKRKFGKNKKHTRLSKQGKSPISVVKRQIQAKLREKAIQRDGGCILRNYTHWLPFSYQHCGPERKDGRTILQAEHLVGRANSHSYAEMDNIVCLCMRHHFYFKTQHGALYWEIIRKHIGQERWSKVQEWAQNKEIHKRTAQQWRDTLATLSTG